MFSRLATVGKDTSTFKEAILSQKSSEWKSAINEELNSMKENGVWKLVDRPLDKK